ncbi:hypothetical protein Pst134EB_001422 [Puccinia striiformis f. sp. tritici]|nr:hypothetical protein Pst134EB_001422 [Puccinia striiformis f. sp. tritici]
MANNTSQNQGPIDNTFQSPFYFFPSLVTQRRAFCLGFLKRQRVRTVLELGCGEGTLLGLLTNAASCLGEFPSPSDIERLNTEQINAKDSAHKERLGVIEEVVKKTPELDYYQRDLHLELLIGLDLDPESLQRVQETIKLTNQKPQPGSFPLNSRWEPLRVELWSGDLALNNDRFKGIGCVVMSEVIEHLFPDQLNQCIPLIFGSYQPQWIVITTPNHEFNQYIDQYSSLESRNEHRFLDPTGRTERYFRDSDHKFEWTRDEFINWCQDVSSTYGYDYTLDGCGSYVNYFQQSISSTEPPAQPIPKSELPVPGSPEGFFATQCVVFKKRSESKGTDDGDKEIAPIGVDHPKAIKPEKGHKLIAVEEYRAHECVGQVAPKSEILEHVKRYLIDIGNARARLSELWLCDQGLDKLCAGRLIELILAFSDEDGWELSNDSSPVGPISSFTGMDAIWVTWIAFPTTNKTNSDIPIPPHYSLL